MSQLVNAITGRSRIRLEAIGGIMAILIMAISPSNALATGGDSCESAAVINSLPFTDAGSTFGFADDFSEACLIPAFIPAADVAYEFTPSQDMALKISLCDPGTNFRNALFVYEGSCSQPNIIACGNDDCFVPPSTNSAEIPCVSVTANTTYYIIIDGVFGAAGNYVLNVSECVPCEFECSVGATPEGEPSCSGGFDPSFNSGCFGAGENFTPLSCGESVCGTSGAKRVTAFSEKDTDAYKIIVATDTEVSITVTSQFQAQLEMLPNGGVDDCQILVDNNTGPMASAVAFPCTPKTVTACVGAGTYWFVIRPTESWVPCDWVYEIELECSPCVPLRGSCCTPAGLCEEDVTLEYCRDYIGSLSWNEGQDCNSTTCMPRMNNPNCEVAPTITAPSVNWGTTVGGDVVEHDRCNGFPIPDDDAGSWYHIVGTGTRLTATTCNDEGLGGQVNLSVFCGTCDTPVCAAESAEASSCSESPEQQGATVSWCTQPGYDYYIWVHHFAAEFIPFQYLLSISDDGMSCEDYPDCDVPTGACCLGDSCVDDGITQAACDAKGGKYHDDESCATFTCPNACPGDTWQTAIVIPSIPFHGEGNTVPCEDHYFQGCDDDPSFGADARDQIYAFTPTENVTVDISLCRNTKIDSKLFVYEGLFDASENPNSAFACSNDACTSPGFPTEGAVSKLEGLSLLQGITYYIGVDGGVFSYRGYYTIDITVTDCLPGQCFVACDPMAIFEDEPFTGDEYDDNFNGGCLSDPPIFSSISCGDIICGFADTYTIGGNAARDTDWYEVVLATDTELQISINPEFDALFGIVSGGVSGDCGLANGEFFVSAVATKGQTEQISVCLPAGTWWIVTLPSSFASNLNGGTYELSLDCVSCSAAIGACCVPGEDCVATYLADCDALGGLFQGSGSVCTPNPCPAIPANDNCDNATVVTANSSTMGSTMNASEETQLPGTTGVWFEVTGTGNIMTISTCNEFIDYDSDISVYCRGCDGNNWEYVRPEPYQAFFGEFESPQQNNNGVYLTEDDWFCDVSKSASTFILCSEQDSKYLVLVSGFQEARGTFRLDVSDDPSQVCESPQPCAPIVLGDMNCDGVVDLLDVSPFVQALIDASAYTSNFPECDIENGDLSEDELVNAGDIHGFVNALLP